MNQSYYERVSGWISKVKAEEKAREAEAKSWSEAQQVRLSENPRIIYAASYNGWHYLTAFKDEGQEIPSRLLERYVRLDLVRDLLEKIDKTGDEAGFDNPYHEITKLIAEFTEELEK
jgi:hypothetical protein